MAVGIRIKMDGLTSEQFDAIERSVNPTANPPEGLIFHASGPIEGGWGVIDFWESRAQFDRFAEERMGPSAAAAGLSAAPDIREFPVHEHFPR